MIRLVERVIGRAPRIHLATAGPSSERTQLCPVHVREILEQFRLCGVWPVPGALLLAAFDATVGNAAFFAGERIIAAVDGNDCAVCLLSVAHAREVAHLSVRVAISARDVL